MNHKAVLMLALFVAPMAMAQDKSHVGRSSGQRGRDKLEAGIQTKSNLNFDVIEGCLDKERKEIYDSLKTGVPFSKLTDKLVSLHFDEATRRDGKNLTDKQKQDEKSKVDVLLRQIRQGLPHQYENLSDLKVAYEKALNSVFKKKDKDAVTVYDAKSNSIADICTKNSLNCVSATALNQVITRALLAEDGFKQHDMVVIYEDGHVLPGFIKKEGEHFRLIGIETTSAGAALVDYGITSELKRPLNVVAAHDWIVSEIFADCLEFPEHFAENLASRAAWLYGIDREATRPPVSDFVATATRAKRERISPFAFGTANVPEGKIARSNFDSVKREELGSNTNSTVEAERVRREKIDAALRAIPNLMGKIGPTYTLPEARPAAPELPAEVESTENSPLDPQFGEEKKVESEMLIPSLTAEHDFRKTLTEGVERVKSLVETVKRLTLPKVEVDGRTLEVHPSKATFSDRVEEVFSKAKLRAINLLQKLKPTVEVVPAPATLIPVAPTVPEALPVPYEEAITSEQAPEAVPTAGEPVPEVIPAIELPKEEAPVVPQPTEIPQD